MQVTFDRIRLGNGRRTAAGWLIKSDGVLRGIMSADADGCVHFGFACDRRIAPVDGYMCFRDLAEAQAWIRDRFASRRCRRPAAPPRRLRWTPPDDVKPRRDLPPAAREPQDDD